MTGECQMDLDSSGDNSSDHSIDNADEFEETAAKDLADGTVSVVNRDGTLWCPFCFGKKKRDYKYADLLQHAKGVSKGSRGAEASGVHRALVKYLNTSLAHLAEAPKERYLHLEQAPPEKIIVDEKLVWPWMGVILNIDNSKVSIGKHVGPGNSEIKSHFAHFHPKSVHTLWNIHGHTGMAIIEFEKNMIGYGEAQDFGRSFTKLGRGKRDWEHKVASGDWLGKELYGWVANQDDYNRDDLVGKHLREKGNLRTVAEVSETFHRQNDQLLQDLDARIREKNQELENSSRQVSGLQALVIETERARRLSELQKACLEEMYKQEIKAIEEAARRNVQSLNEKINFEREKLDSELKNLQKRCEELELKEVHNETERLNKERELDKNEKKMQVVLQIQELHKQQEAKKRMLIKKQEEESNSLLSDLHRQQKNLVNQHKLEQEIQALEAMIESKRLEAIEKTDDQSEISSLEDESDLNNLEEQLNELREEKQNLEEMNNHLTCKQRELNDELQDAMKAAVMVLEQKGDCKSIGLKRMGELNCEPWEVLCKERFKNHEDGWQTPCGLLISSWEENVRDASWYPFKTVEVEGGKCERRIDRSDEKLSKLLEECGEGVFNSVEQALSELNEYNASGRYPVAIPWNFQEQRRATLAEIIRFLCPEEKPPPKRSRRRRRR